MPARLATSVAACALRVRGTMGRWLSTKPNERALAVSGLSGFLMEALMYSGSGRVEARVAAVDLLVPSSGPNASTSGCEASDFGAFPRGAIALLQRGACTFRQKVANAIDAGARAVIVFNEGNPGRREPFAATLGAPQVTVPALAASFELGGRYPQIPAAVAILDAAVAVPATARPAMSMLIEKLKGASYRDALREFVARAFFIATDDDARMQRILREMSAAPRHVAVAAFEGIRDYNPNEAASSIVAPILYVTANESPPRSEVERLLADSEVADAFLERPAAVAGFSIDRWLERDARSAIDDVDEEEVPHSIGGYAIRSTIASGGMGIVYLAEQRSPRRLVALNPHDTISA